MIAAILHKLDVHVYGKGEPTIVFAHGFGSDQTAWRHQVNVLKERHRVVVFDYLGCGKSDIGAYNPLRYGSSAGYCSDVLELYEALDLRNTIFVGHSVSAMIGTLLSRQQPALFSKLVFIGASPRYLNDDAYHGGFEQANLNTVYEAMAANYLAWVSGFAPMVVGAPDRPELGQEFANSLAAMHPDIAQSTARWIFEADLRDELPFVQQAVLLLQTANDIFVPTEVGTYMALHIPHSHLVILEGQGHLPHLSMPAIITRAIQDFIAEA